MRLVLDARTASFAALIDYAGLFPPASLTMEEAVAEYRRLLVAPERWTLGRFLCPASRLEQLAGVASASFKRGDRPWQIGVIFDMSPGASASVAQDFHAELDGVLTVSAAESRPDDTSEASIGALIDTMRAIDQEVVPFIEVDFNGDIHSQTRAIAHALHERNHHGAAKIRCGGLDVSMFPSVEQVGDLLWEASLEDLPFKATAGLHQPIRHFDDALGGWRHGFVNLLMAAAAIDAGEDKDVIIEILSETDAASLTIGATFAQWRHLSLPGSAIRRTRNMAFVSYGSCDVVEPIEALEALDYLGSGS